MRRLLSGMTVLALVCTMGVAIPAGSAATASTASAKSKCKKRHPHHRKLCRRKKRQSTTEGTSGTGGTGGTSGPPGRVLATSREISSTELQLQLSRPSVAAGPTIVEQYNAGSDPHNLVLEKGGFAEFTYPTLDPGGDQKQTVTLTHGTWTLYCSLLDHRSLGMQATLTVN